MTIIANQASLSFSQALGNGFQQTIAGIFARLSITPKLMLSDHQQETIDLFLPFCKRSFGHSRLLSRPRWVCQRRLWVYATRLPDNQLLILVTQKRPQTPLADYAQRWGIETLFGVFKTRGFCLESTHFRDKERLNKLIALLSLAVVWAFKTGLWLH